MAQNITREQINKQYMKKGVINPLLIFGAATVISAGSVFYGNHKYKQAVNEANTNQTHLVQKYQYLRDNVLPYLRAQLKEQDYPLFDNSLASEGLKEKLEKVDEKDLSKKRNLEEAVSIAVQDSSELAQTPDVIGYKGRLQRGIDSSNRLIIFAMSFMMGLYSLSAYKAWKAGKEKDRAIFKIEASKFI